MASTQTDLQGREGGVARDRGRERRGGDGVAGDVAHVRQGDLHVLAQLEVDLVAPVEGEDRRARQRVVDHGRVGRVEGGPAGISTVH
jgi:hypothetical protein